MRTRILASVVALSLAGIAQAESIGDKLAAKGYTSTLFVAQPNAPGSIACQWGRCMVGSFDPSKAYDFTPASHMARWGVDGSSAVVKGNTVGERLGSLACAAQTLGLPAGYVVTFTDQSDAKVLTKPGQLVAAWDAELSAMTCGGGPSPAGCVAPKVCMTPPAPCETCDVCPTCPPPPPACAPLTVYLRAQLAKQSGWSGIITPGRARALRTISEWAKSCP